MTYQGTLRVEPAPVRCPTCGESIHYDALRGCLYCDGGYLSDVPASPFAAMESDEQIDVLRVAKDVAVIGVCLTALAVLTPAFLFGDSLKLVAAAVSRRLKER